MLQTFFTFDCGFSAIKLYLEILILICKFSDNFLTDNINLEKCIEQSHFGVCCN